jgi:hypothetical protein
VLDEDVRNVEPHVGDGELQRAEQPLGEQVVHPGPALRRGSKRVGRGDRRREPAERGHGRCGDAGSHRGKRTQHGLYQGVGEPGGCLGHSGLVSGPDHVTRPPAGHRRLHPHRRGSLGREQSS